MRRAVKALAALLAVATLWPAGTAATPLSTLRDGLLAAFTFDRAGFADAVAGVKFDQVAGTTFFPILTRRAGRTGQTGALMNTTPQTIRITPVPPRLRVQLPITIVWFGGYVGGALPVNNAGIFTTRRDASTDAFTVWIQAGAYRLAVGSSLFNTGTTPAVTDNMIAVRATATTFDWFVNGRWRVGSTGAFTVGTYDNNSKWELGGTVNSNALYRELLVYRRTLSNAEIAELWLDPLAWQIPGGRLDARGGGAPAAGFSPFLIPE